MTSGENWPEGASAALSSLPCMTLSRASWTAWLIGVMSTHAGGQVDRAADVDPGIEQGRERASEPAGVELAEERAEDRRHQDHAVHHGLARRGLVEAVDQERRADHEPAE